MTMRQTRLLLVAVLAAGLVLWIGWSVWPTAAAPLDWVPLPHAPHIRPDYAGATIPPNIAPLNFVVEEPGTAYHVRIGAPDGPYCDVRSRDGAIRIPPATWQTVLAHYRGKTLPVEVYVRDAGHRWQRLEPFAWTVAQDEIDPYLTYRLLDPLYNVYMHLGIYQLNLETSEESPVISSDAIGKGCINCHTFPHNRPDPFLFHVRTGDDPSIPIGMVVVRDDKPEVVQPRADVHPGFAAFSSWHPNQELVAFSLNDTVQDVHGNTTETREVYDRRSDLAVVHLATGAVTAPRTIADPTQLETFPCWSPDGKYLYFCRAADIWKEVEPSLLQDYAKVKYDLVRVPYDVASDTWGDVEVLLAAADTGTSMVQPRVSPDGRFVLFCACDHGSFPAFRAASDLHMLDLTDRTCRRLDANSDQSESWHSWSGNSRWIVFASRRANGYVAWPYLCYIDPSGQDHRPLLLPQHDPRFYDTRLKTYNLPELVAGPISVDPDELKRALRSKGAGSKPAAAKGSGEEGYGGGRE